MGINAYTYKQKLIKDFNDEAVDLVRKGYMESEESYQTWFTEYIETLNIYSGDCWDIIEATNYDVFEHHHAFGRPKDVYDAAYNALYDFFMEHGITHSDACGIVKTQDLIKNEQ